MDKRSSGLFCLCIFSHFEQLPFLYPEVSATKNLHISTNCQIHISILHSSAAVFVMVLLTAAGGDDSEQQTVTTDEYTRTQQFTVERMSEDLRRLVTESSSQPQPFILVGSELGALIAR